MDRLLDHSIQHRRDAQHALSAVGLWDRMGPYRRGLVSPAAQRRLDLRPIFTNTLPTLLYIQSIHARRAVIRLYLYPRGVQVLSRQYAFQRDRLRCPVSRIEFTPVVRPSRGLLPTLAMFPGIHPGSSFASSGEAAVIATPRQFRRTSRHSDRSSLVDRAFLFLQPFAPARFPGLLRYYGLC